MSDRSRAFGAAGADEERQARYRAGRRVTLVSVAANTLLAIGKIIAGVVGNSAAMVADGVHSASDLISDGVVLVGMRIASRDADEDHPYGHGKFETLATQFIALALLGVALGIVYDAVVRIQSPVLAAPRGIALAAAVVSLAVKEWLYQYTVRVGRRWRSKALIANAWHHRSDAVSSIAAFIGIAGGLLGFPVLDPVAAIAVAFILGKVGVDLLRDAVKELTDSTAAIDSRVQDQIVGLVESTGGIRSAHFVNARRLGPDIRVDVHVVVDPFLSVSEGHQIADKVRLGLLDKVEGVTDVLVHVDPVDDAEQRAVPLLAERAELVAAVLSLVPSDSLLGPIEGVTPHYTHDGILLEVQLAEHRDLEREALCAAARALCQEVVKRHDDVVAIRVNQPLAQVGNVRAES